MHKYLISIQYDGTEYNGFAPQPKGLNTIYSVLFNKIKLILKNVDFELKYASRTDAGTHAYDQKCLLSIPFELKNSKSFQNTLNTILPTTIFINNIIKKNNQFDIHSYIKKQYVYTIDLSNEYNIFLSRKELKINQNEFNLKKFKKILKIFIGYHNFINFSKVNENSKKSTFRKILNIKYKSKQNKLTILFEARGFLRYQIRYIIGTSIAYAENQISYKQIKTMLESNDKIANKYKAPSNGLILFKIIY